ncbi:MAG: type I-U CRISPR-associated protein Cas5/Cas6 [Chromatiaceae bacterium]|nr:type I-U CRISPR-associated protein Cas5/Cas6 [Chromatiaceae bacterium]MBP6733595.1 type I-U CRISPR-associated protein Cas5/Cas6 [Chromatiaceae bacterium]MBP6806920.1 type I-U CRISPR-associated protein Cas5/Cas6 [Chromatiaceae bacterium]MBP8282470.1 type I-U CRISPR-associated protein Cas5/Cas6 [Chromatiaceae bacterium]MBP8288382.1 type I-U CRISPR-associated protein Cas5/Cas6 [Chromatiaceae bacterium]
MIVIQAEFLRGCYVAADPTRIEAPEWPPAPARLFSALVASAYALGLDPGPLTTLELAPEVRHGDALKAPGTINYVSQAFFNKGDRPKQATRRPQMVGIEDPVYFAWDVPLDPDWLKPVLDGVTYLGRAESPVRLSLAPDLPAMPHHLAPDPQGETLLRVPVAGWLAQLQVHYASGARLVAPYVPYADPRAQVADTPWGELLVLRPDGGNLCAAAQLGDGLRRAVMSHAPERMSPLLHGHEKVPHAAWLTLPDVGHPHAAGRVLGLGMLLPRVTGRAERDEAVLALSQVRELCLEDGQRLELRPQPAHQPTPQGIERRTWARASRSWTTATPIVLERHPRRGQSVEDLIADTCERWGYPRPIGVEIGQHSPLRGVPMAEAFRPRRPGCWTHAVLHWDRPVRGPVLIGREQHFGLGLLRPLLGEG